MKSIIYIVLGAIFLGGAGFISIGFLSPTMTATPSLVVPTLQPIAQNEPPTERTILENSSTVIMGDIEIPVEVVRTDAEITKGLSGRVSLDPNSGMLFVFQKSDKYRFWMPDMHFAIDIVWIENGKVAAIDQNISPIFDPKNPKFYTPPVPVRHVLELNAGFVADYGIEAGDAVTFMNVD